LGSSALVEGRHADVEPSPARSGIPVGLGGKKDDVARALSRILAWDFERVVIAHGDLIEHNAKEIVQAAWEKPLRWA
jgi:hypothetical protein